MYQLNIDHNDQSEVMAPEKPESKKLTLYTRNDIQGHSRGRKDETVLISKDH